MKKKIIAASSALFLLVGCGNATTQVSNKSKVLVTIGDTEVTDGDIYKTLKAQNDIAPINEKMSNILIDKVVPVTKELEDAAKAVLDTYKTQYGDDWTEKLKNAGYDSEDVYLKDVILVNERAKKLTEVFVKEDFDNLSEKYKPRMVEIVQVKSADETKAALAEAKKGTALSEIATKYGDTTTYDGKAKVYNSKSKLSDVLWNNIVDAKKDGSVAENIIQDTATQGYYIVKVTKTNPAKFKNEAIASIKEITIENKSNQAETQPATTDTELSLDDQAFAYFLQKYNYSIHDVDVYKALLTSSKKYER